MPGVQILGFSPVGVWLPGTQRVPGLADSVPGTTIAGSAGGGGALRMSLPSGLIRPKSINIRARASFTPGSAACCCCTCCSNRWTSRSSFPVIRIPISIRSHAAQDWPAARSRPPCGDVLEALCAVAIGLREHAQRVDPFRPSGHAGPIGDRLGEGSHRGRRVKTDGHQKAGQQGFVVQLFGLNTVQPRKRRLVDRKFFRVDRLQGRQTQLASQPADIDRLVVLAQPEFENQDRSQDPGSQLPIGSRLFRGLAVEKAQGELRPLIEEKIFIVGPRQAVDLSRRRVSRHAPSVAEHRQGVRNASRGFLLDRFAQLGPGQFGQPGFDLFQIAALHALDLQPRIAVGLPPEEEQLAQNPLNVLDRQFRLHRLRTRSQII